MAINKRVILLALIVFSFHWQSGHATFVSFESGQVRPIAQSPDGNRLFVVNTPDNSLEIFNVNNGSPVLLESVSVGLEPVAVAAWSNSQVWVVNYLSDSISIVDVSTTPARVIKTLLVGDEPADIVFAGTGGNRAFITTAHRGQNSPYTDPNNPGELTTPGIGRADVWVFDANNTGSSLGGNPVAIVTLFGDTPKALAVASDGKTVYAAIFKSGNQTTVMHEEVVCDASDSVPCFIKSGEVSGVGKLPPPNPRTIGGQVSPETGLIVKYNGSQWVDELGVNWSSLVRFNLPDKDVFAIDADALVPVESDSFAHVGTVLYNMAVNPVSGKVYVANTEAINEVRFEGPGSVSTTVQGHLHEARITVIDPGTGQVSPVHLNKHINYNVSPAPAGVSDNSLATPKGIAVTGDGATLYVVAKGSGKVGVFDTIALENNFFTPDSASHINLSAGGPDGLLLDEENNRLYVTTRFDNALSVIDTASATEINHIGLHNPEPPGVIAGRQFLHDAKLTSSNGEASCASCHIEGDKDELAWDLGNPDGAIINNNNPFALFFSSSAPYHPMKGPLTTQTLRGMADHGPMHWRGDRSGANDGGDALDEDLAFKTFNVAFEGLLGRSGPLSAAQMQAYTDFILQVTPPPNPIRALDNSLTPDQQAGRDFYFGPVSDIVANCNGCHVLDPATGFFGTNGLMSFEGAIQDLKVPQLRNMYEKVGMFGMADIPFNNSGNNGYQGDQIRGFGFTHDGSIDTLLHFLNAQLFQFPLGNVQRRQVEQFIFAFDSNLKPVVGQQVTISGTEGINTGPVRDRVNLLMASAGSHAEIVVKMNISGESRGAYLVAGTTFEMDTAMTPPYTMTDAEIRALALTPGQEVTYTAVPPGSGYRTGVDRDEDNIKNYDDNCPAYSNAGQEDNESDGVGDVCDPDDDNDGLSDAQENVLGTNSLVADTDGDGFNDYFEHIAGNNPLDKLDFPVYGDINGDGKVDTVDLIKATQFVISLSTPTEAEMLRGDVAPLAAGIPDPDAVFNAGDLLLIQRKVFNLVSF